MNRPRRRRPPRRSWSAGVAATEHAWRCFVDARNPQAPLALVVSLRGRRRKS